MERIETNLPDPVAEWLEAAAVHYGVSKSEVLRRGLVVLGAPDTGPLKRGWQKGRARKPAGANTGDG